MNLVCRQISKEFLRKRSGTNIFCAVKTTDFELAAGKLTMIGGRSGGGKSTLLNMMSGLLAPSSGTVLADDADIYAMSDEELSRFRNEHFGVIPQGQTGIFSLSVKENILLPLFLYGVDKKDADAFTAASTYAEELMDLCGIADLADVMPSELSGGEMRRTAIARALICHPNVIFADEPTGDLDDATSEIVLKLLRAAADEGRAVMLVTHEAAAAHYADSIFRMDAGVLKRER